METLLTSGEKLHLFHDLIPTPTPPTSPLYTHLYTSIPNVFLLPTEFPHDFLGCAS